MINRQHIVYKSNTIVNDCSLETQVIQEHYNKRLIFFEGYNVLYYALFYQLLQKDLC